MCECSHVTGEHERRDSQRDEDAGRWGEGETRGEREREGGGERERGRGRGGEGEGERDVGGGSDGGRRTF